MGTQDKYIMLMASLPRPGPLFGEKQTPISRIRLDRRLRQLQPEDAATLAAVEWALEWRRMTDDPSDEDVLKRVRDARASIQSATLDSVILRRMEIRTCLAALRRRAAGQDAPHADEPWGYGRWLGRMIQNWGAPGFGIDHIFPWLKEADRLLAAGEAFDLERLCLEVVYRDLSRHGGLHQFDIEAVVIYVLKWSVIDRWSRYNAEAASRRFGHLLKAGLDTAAQSAGAGREVMGARP